MKIYYISQEQNTGYDTYSDAVVIAESEEDAKTIHPNGAYYKTDSDGRFYTENWNGEKDYHNSTWCNRTELVTVEYLGEAKEGSARGVVCASFHAG